MSRETALWLNQMTLIGDTDKRGTAWHYRADLQDGTGNHFPGAIPTDRISELFAPWEPVESPLYVEIPEGSGNYIQVDGRKAITPIGHPESILGVFSSDFQIHGYDEWLHKGLSNLVDGDVHFSSAGLLMNGAVAWCELSISETQTVADFEFKPHVLAYTSVNGKYATTFGRKVQAVVCDNTLSVAAAEKGDTVKVKHSKYSRMALQSARDTLGIIVGTAEAFTAEIEALAALKVNDAAFGKVVDTLIPLDTETMTKMAATKAEAKRDRIWAMYRNDARCAPWSGTAFGVVQTFNTWSHHEKEIRSSKGVKGIRAERNMVSAIDGTIDKETANVMNALTLAGVGV